MYKTNIAQSFLFIIIFALLFDAFPMTTFIVAKTGRKVQLDGFLLEWPKDGAKKMGAASLWMWDALNTKEGLTGYFKAPAAAGNDWTFLFLPERLSSYSKMKLSFSSDSGQSFYRISRPGSSLDSSMTGEWVIPWATIAIDSLGKYKVGIVAYSDRGDTLPAMVLAGEAPRENAPPSWGKVYFKAALLVALLGVLFYIQRKIKRKTAPRSKKRAVESTEK
jgi:hypothetical protein